MDDEQKTPDDSYSMKLAEYLIGRIAALEKRIELLEGKAANPAESGGDLLKELISRSDALDKKLDILIGRTANVSEAGGIEDIGGQEVNVQPEMRSADMKRSVAVFIDGENISNKKAEKIMEKSGNRGEIRFARVYNVKDTPSDKCWVNTSQEFNIKHIRLPGSSKKNKVDKHMFSEIYNEAKKTGHADMLIIATNDTDFIPTIKEVRDMGVCVVIMGLKASLSDKMKKACNSFVYL